MKLLIIGAGGYGHLTKEIAELCGYTQIDFLDDDSEFAISKIEKLEKIQGNYDGTIVAIGNPEVRKMLLDRVETPVTLIHPKAAVSSSAVIGRGCVIEANTIISASANIGRGSLICAGAVINHNSFVGEFCQIDCNAVVAAGTSVPERTKVLSCTVWD